VQRPIHGQFQIIAAISASIAAARGESPQSATQKSAQPLKHDPAAVIPPGRRLSTRHYGQVTVEWPGHGAVPQFPSSGCTTPDASGALFAYDLSRELGWLLDFRNSVLTLVLV
jgi:hypothetical protein